MSAAPYVRFPILASASIARESTTESHENMPAPCSPIAASCGLPASRRAISSTIWSPRDIETLTPGARALCGAAHPAGQDHRGFLRGGGAGERRRGFYHRLPGGARAGTRCRSSPSTGCAPRSRSRTTDLAVLAAWDGDGATANGIAYRDPRLPALGLRVLVPPDAAQEAAADLGATWSTQRI